MDVHKKKNDIDIEILGENNNLPFGTLTSFTIRRKNEYEELSNNQNVHIYITIKTKTIIL